MPGRFPGLTPFINEGSQEGKDLRHPLDLIENDQLSREGAEVQFGVLKSGQVGGALAGGAGTAEHLQVRGLYVGEAGGHHVQMGSVAHALPQEAEQSTEVRRGFGRRA